MNYKGLQKCTAFAMAVLVLLSTLSITIEKHYCADTLVDVALFTKAKSCCSSSTTTKTKTEEKGGCCNNETDLLIGQDELSLTKPESLRPYQALFLVAMAYTYNSQNTDSTEDKPDFRAYAPPDLSQDIQLLNEVFLI